jgi:hypothetical protein
MSQTVRNGPGQATRTASEITNSTDITVPQHADLPQAAAIVGAPCRGRGLWLVVVTRCPLCGRMHQHRAGRIQALMSGEVGKACPVTGRSYLISPRPVVRHG